MMFCKFTRHTDGGSFPYGSIEPDLNTEIALVLWIHEFTVSVTTLHVVEAKDGTVLLLPPIVGCDHGLSAFLQCPRVVEETVITIVVFGGYYRVALPRYW